MSLVGNVAEMPLADILQIHATNRRSCVIHLRTPHANGEIYLHGGEIVHARFGDRVGNEAVYAMLSEQELHYEAKSTASMPKSTITKGWQTLIMEAAQLQDEGVSPRDEPPPFRSRESITRPPIENKKGHSPKLAAAIFLLVLTAGAGLYFGVFRVGQPGKKDQNTAVREPVPVVSKKVPVFEATDLIGSNDESPTLLSGKPPVLPENGLSVAPTIVCRLLIDTSGRVAESRIYRSRLELAVFEELAIETVNRYRFSPGIHDGESVPVWINWPVSFTEPKPPERTMIHIKGSDTIGGALGPDLARAFSERNPHVSISVEALGSSTAFAGLFDGSAEIGASSRSVNESELEQAAKPGIRLKEFVIGYDGIAIIVHPDNPIRSVTLDQASRVFSGEIANWRELGGPDMPIKPIGRPDYSGTHVFFKTRVLRRGDKNGPEEFAGRTEYIEHTEQITKRVASDPAAVAYVGLGWAKGKVVTLGISPGPDKPGIHPDLDTIRQGNYPIYRPLMMYTGDAPSGEIKNFLRFILANPGRDIVHNNGFVPSDTSVAGLFSTVESDHRPAAAAPVVKRIWFSSGGARLDNEALAELEKIAVYLLDGKRRIIVVGHADALGNNLQNSSLAEARAVRVAAFLRLSGVDPQHIEIESQGETKPIATNESEEGRRENRRVDLYILDR